MELPKTMITNNYIFKMYKRLWQSGSNARFHGIDWNGSEGDFDGVFAYQENVVNAFKTAPRLAAYVNSLTGTVHAIAHSLGNRIVSAGIQDHSMQADTYFMLNAAVAAEAYDPSLWNPTDSPSNPMVHSDWYGYTNACWASLWFTHWPTSQPLHKLTWRGRFADIFSSTKVINFYSSGEEVLALYLNGTPNTYTGITTDFGIYSWHKQEMQKGRFAYWGTSNYFSNVNFAGTTWMGWAFDGFYDHDALINGPTKDEANSASLFERQFYPVFRHDPYPNMTYIPSNSQINEMLAKGIPALSGPAGSRPILEDDDSVTNSFFNLNLQVSYKPNGWPSDGHKNFAGKWLHSDIKNVAYRFLYGVFEQFVEEGDLK